MAQERRCDRSSERSRKPQRRNHLWVWSTLFPSFGPFADSYHRGVIREKDSADLFTLDTKRDAALSKKFNKHTSKKGLKADEIIAARSAVPAVSSRKRSNGKTSDGLLPVKRQRTDWVSQKDLARLRKVADGQHDNTVEVRDANYDMWDAPVQEEDPMNFLPEKVEAKVPKSMKQPTVSLLANGKSTPAVQKPTDVHSYMPDEHKWEEHLATEGQKALDVENKRLAAEEADRLKQEAAARSAAEAEAAEARANLSEWEEDSEWDGFQSGAEEDRPVIKRPQRKTPTQRNKAKRRKEEERLAKHKAAMKARRVQEQKIKELAQQVDDKEAQRALILAQKQLDLDSDDDALIEQKLRRKQLGKYKLPERDLELVLPDERKDNLRSLKPEGNLLRDRYRNMLLNGKVEARRHLPFKKQAKRKSTEKWTHKDFNI